MVVTTRWQALTPPLLMASGSPFKVTDFGPGTRVIAYEPEFVVNDAAVGSDGTLYITYMWALLNFVSGGGPFPYKLAVLTAGVLRPIPSPLVAGPAYVSMLNANEDRVVLNAGAEPYILDEKGLHRLISRVKFAPDDDTGRPPPLALVNGERCAPPADKHRSALDVVSRNGRRRVLLTPRQLGGLSSAHDMRVSCYHFGVHNIFAIGGPYDEPIYVAFDDTLHFLVNGQVLASGDHRLLIVTDAGGNHQWLLEGFATD